MEIAVLLKYLSNFRALGMPLINCENSLVLTGSAYCIIVNSTDSAAFAITDTELFFPVVALSTEGNSKLLQKLININQSVTARLNNYLDYLIDPSFQEIKKLLFYQLKVEIKRRNKKKK